MCTRARPTRPNAHSPRTPLCAQCAPRRAPRAQTHTVPQNGFPCPPTPVAQLNSRLLQQYANKHGIVSRSTVLHAGFDRSVWRRAIDRGDLIEVSRGAAVLPGTHITPNIRIAATLITAGPGAVASHRSAAYLWSVHPVGDRPVDVIRPRGRILADAPRHRIETHRPIDASELQVMVRDGIAVTSPARTLIDLAAVAANRVSDALTEFRIAGFVSIDDVERELERRPINAAGMAAARDALHTQVLLERPPDSVLEARFAELCVTHGLPPMRFQVEILGYRVDFLVAGTKVIVECDGFAFHGQDPRRVEHDRRRDADLVRAGYRVLRFTWRMITSRPAEVAATIRAALTPVPTAQCAPGRATRA